MADLFACLALLAIVSLAVLLFAWRLGCRLNAALRCGLLLGTLFLGAAFALYIWQDVRLASWLPFSGLIVLGNWLPLFSAAMIGLAWPQIGGGPIRRLSLCATLYATAWLTVVWPLLGEPEPCGELWTHDGYCMQTTDSTCTAACAASLLGKRGIAATEQEMAELCLTRCGTSWQGLYRGLKQKTKGTSWSVRIVRGDVDDLLAAASEQSPLILSVGLEHDVEVDGFYELEQGWKPGLRHSVLLLGESIHHRAKIVDPNPALGHEQWTLDDLKMLYRGPAIQLIRR